MKTLKEYLTIFKENMENKVFVIHLSNGDSFSVQFQLNNFPHLLGLSHCAQGRQVKEFSGRTAIELIESEELTLERLKSLNKKAFDKYVVSKIESFEFFLSVFPNRPNMMEGIVFDSSRVLKVIDRTLQKAKLIVQDIGNPNIKHVIIFGEETNNNEEILFPLSIRKETNQTVDYLDMQTKHRIIDISITEEQR